MAAESHKSTAINLFRDFQKNLIGGAAAAELKRRPGK
jgi:hypothetical protein